MNFDKMKVNLMEELRPAVKFLGYDINEKLQECILKNQEGYHHRPEKSKNETDKIMSFISPSELEEILKTKNEVLAKLEDASICKEPKEVSYVRGRKTKNPIDF